VRELKIKSEIKQIYDEQGYILMKGLFTVSEMENIRKKAFKIWMDILREGKINYDPKNVFNSIFPRIASLHLYNEEMIKYMIDPRVMDILEILAGEELLAFLQNYYFKGPGDEPIPIHQDNYEACAEPRTTYTSWISIDSTDKENGGLFFVPGTQDFDILEDESKVKVPTGYKIVDIKTEPGDVVFFNGNVYHGSYANRSKYRFRHSFLTHYVGKSVKKIAINHNQLIDRYGNKFRTKYNLSDRYHPSLRYSNR
jgi:phytanoyl-CoA hydroxylase